MIQASYSDLEVCIRHRIAERDLCDSIADIITAVANQVYSV